MDEIVKTGAQQKRGGHVDIEFMTMQLKGVPYKDLSELADLLWMAPLKSHAVGYADGLSLLMHENWFLQKNSGGCPVPVG